MNRKFHYLVLVAMLVLPAPSVWASERLEVFNFASQQIESIDPSKLTAESGKNYLPQMPEALAIYDLYIARGHEPVDALLKSYQELMIVLNETAQPPSGGAQ